MKPENIHYRGFLIVKHEKFYQIVKVFDSVVFVIMERQIMPNSNWKEDGKSEIDSDFDLLAEFFEDKVKMTFKKIA